MFSYRHGFHAGNHADVLKHLVLVHLLDYLGRKDKPFWFIDTHAGGGSYDLTSGYAAKSREFETGIARLWDAKSPPAAVAAYLDEVRKLNPDGALRRYPGSPQIALQMARPADRLRLFELHPTESGVLTEAFASAGRQVLVQAADGFTAINALLPPPPRRALTLIDPSYENKEDYKYVTRTVAECLRRFATGVYLVWYPQVQRRESEKLPEQLRRLATGSWLHASLTVHAPAEDGLGLHGSGVFVYNPPYTLEGALRQALPFVLRLLTQDAAATFSLDGRQV